MQYEIDALEIAAGLKDALINSGLTIESILQSGPVEIASVLGIDVYVAKIIFEATEKSVNSNRSKEQQNDMVELENM
jgi:hypothetical protein